jgi:flagellin
MSSILTNSSSMVALQTIRGINKGLSTVQAEISSGLKIGNAKDNASVWAIASTMRSDVAGFKQVQDGLGTALAAVNVGRNATESITDALKEMRAKIAAASAVGADTAKIQTDIDNLREQITTIVDAASFNGINFVNSAAGASVLTSIDRTNGTVATDDKFLTVDGVDLTAGTAGAARAAFTSDNFDVAAEGDLLAFSANADTAAVDTVTIDSANLAAGDKFQISVGGRTATYTVTQSDIDATTPADVIAVKLKAAVENLGVDGFYLDYDAANPGELIVNNDGTGSEDRNVMFSVSPAGTGGLSTLNTIDVSSATGRTAALATVDTALNTVIDAAAALGSTQKRLEIQQDFIGKLADNLKDGLSALVDADMEEASARLAALQTQQQLGIQSLSIANQSPQSILSLFR